MKIKVSIVDDEALGRERLRQLLSRESDMEIVGDYSSGSAAVAGIKDAMPDLLLLDVQMPEMNGFEVLQSLGELLPVVIFVTAHDNHAVAAFEARALDYVLKPVKPSRFKQALAQARERIASRDTGEISRRMLALLEGRTGAPGHLNRFAVRTNDRIIFVRVSEVDWIEHAGNYAVLHCGKQAHLLRETMSALEASLPPEQFVRVSRSSIVNIDCIRELQPMARGEYTALLRDGHRLSVTRGIRELETRLKFA
jgi:two-component system, LytTR family, response regulator